MISECFIQENKMLKNEVEKLSKIFNYAPVAICIIDQCGKVLFLNDSCSYLFNYPKEHIIGRKINEYFLLNTLLEKMISGILKNKKHLKSYPCVINAAKGEIKYIELSVSPLSEGKTTEFICVMVDITKKKDAEEKVLRSNKQFATLQKISDVVNESLDLSRTLNSTLREILSLTSFSAGVVAIIDCFGRKLNPVAHQGLNKKEITMLEKAAPGPKYIEWLSSVSRPLVTIDAQNDSRLTKCTFIELGYSTIISIPLRARNRTWGSLSIFSSKISEFSDEDIELLMAIGQQVGVAIENSHLYQAEYEKRKMLQSLVEISTQLCSSLKLETVLNNILELLGRVISFDSAVIIQVSEKEVKMISTRGKIGDVYTLIGFLLEKENQIFSEHLVRLIEDNMVEIKKNRDANIKSYLCKLLLIKGKTIGVIIIGKSEARFYSEADEQILSAFANNAAIAIENAQLYEQTKAELKLRDELLQEMHHRIRNNLDMLLSLLQMEYDRYSQEAPIRNSLQSVIERIESVSLAHTLFSLDSVSCIEADKLVEVCVNFAFKIAKGLEKDLFINYDADTANWKLPSKKALATALILNELLTNAIHHAFDTQKHGIIQVNLKKQDNQINMLVADNGKGFPPGFNLDDSPGMGLKIVKNLVNRELKGNINISKAKNTKIEVSYSL